MASFTHFKLFILLASLSLIHAQNHFVPRLGRHGHAHVKKDTDAAPFSTNSTSASDDSCSYWLEDIAKQGLAPYAAQAGSYQVFRNVQDFGAAGDGVADDTAAINRAISDGGRCGPGTCNSTTTTPAIVYFPPGTYRVTAPIVDYYYTQLIGNPNCLPVIKADSGFSGPWVIDGDPYGANGLQFGATNVFWRQVRNFILDMTEGPSALMGVHWPTGQATSLQNMAFQMSKSSGTQQAGVFIESGSGGFMTDLSFYGGNYGMNIGSQQFTMRNMTFDGCNNAIHQLYDWGWTYTGLSINNCQVGLNMTQGGSNAQSVGSITLIDSEINNTPVGVLTAFTDSKQRFTNGSLIVENVALNNVPVAIQGPSSTLLAGSGGSTTIAAWGQGHAYSPQGGPVGFQGPIVPNNRPAGLLEDGKFYTRSKPQYGDLPASSFLSARSAGAKGDGQTDDTAALQAAIASALSDKKILFIDAGDYVVTSTIYFPGGSVVVGEAYPVIIGAGAYFSDVNNPKPIVQIGKSGEQGSFEWSDTIVSTRGATAGAILFEYNLASGPPGSQCGMHKRNDWGQWSSTPAASSTSGKPVSPASSPGVCGAKSKPADSVGPSSQTQTSSATWSYWPSQSKATWDSWGSGLPSTSRTWNTWGYTQSPEATSTTKGSPSSWTTTKTKSWSTWASATGTTGPTGTSTPKPPKGYEPCGPGGMWDVHARVGGFAGSNLQLADCPTTPQVAIPPSSIDQNCIASFMTMHITASASNVYHENCWLWVADHDVEDPNVTQITIYAGRGLLIESSNPVWLWGGAVEHHTLYQYQLNKASNLYMGHIQTETAYYQPNPPAYLPFAPVAAYNDPDFSEICYNKTGFNFTSSTDFTNNCDGWGLRIVDSSEILIYTAGLYSFFDNYNTSCSAVPSDPSGPYGCQTSIFSIEGDSSAISVYNLMTVGAQSMIDINGKSIASYVDNLNVFPDVIALFKTN